MIDTINRNAKTLDKFLKNHLKKQGHSQLIAPMKYGVLFGGKKIFIPKRPREPKRSLANISKIKKDINWKPKISIQEGIKRLLKN